jgi:hypothetical protein
MEILENMREINDLKAILRELEYPGKKRLINDIKHIAKTFKHKGLQILVRPASCKACGYQFDQKGLTLKIPSKCPECKEERIKWPSIKIEEV